MEDNFIIIMSIVLLSSTWRIVPNTIILLKISIHSTQGNKEPSMTVRWVIKCSPEKSLCIYLFSRYNVGDFLES